MVGFFHVVSALAVAGAGAVLAVCAVREFVFDSATAESLARAGGVPVVWARAVMLADCCLPWRS